MDQPEAPRRIVEFTYLMLPILLWTPTKRETGGVLMLMPAGIETPPFSPGFLQNHAGSPMILLSLHANRGTHTVENGEKFYVQPRSRR
jgi:hypothetical protein